MDTVYDEELPVLERIKLPMVWQRLAMGVRVEDLQPPRYDQAIEIVKNHFIPDDPMYKGSKLEEDEESVKEFLEMVLIWMQNTQSFLAVEEATDEAVGVLIGRVNERDAFTQTLSRMRIYRSDVYGKIRRFESQFIRVVDLYNVYNTDSFYKVYVWCVIRSYRDRGVGQALLRTAIDQTISYKMTLVAGLFTGAVSQHIARKMKFQTQFEILYKEWKENERNTFEATDDENCSATLMAKVIQSLEKSIN